MLTLYGAFDVPNVSNVKIYRDDEVPHRFYMVSERATIARDDQNKPICLFMLYARDVDRLAPDDLQVERAYLAITTQAAVDKTTETKIRDFLKQKLTEEARGSLWFLRNPVIATEPELGYPPLWLEGKVEFRAVPDDLVIKSFGSTNPSLIGTNVASFTAHLDQDGAELFRQAAEKGKIPAGVWYELKFAARIPAITIRVKGDRSAFYSEVKNYIRRRYEQNTEWDIFGITYFEEHYIYEWDELSSISKFRGAFQNLTITVDDSTLPGDERASMKDELEKMAFSIVQTNVLPEFFKQAFQDAGKEIKDPQTHIPIQESMSGTIDLTFSRSQLVAKNANPNSLLLQAMTPEEVKASTVYVDLDQTYFQDLNVAVHANVNFVDDPVFALKVFLDYDQQDEQRNVRVRKSDEFLFRSADQIENFRLVLAKGADGAAKDAYRYWSQIDYKDTGETIRVPASGMLESREQQLVISYRRLGFVKVNLALGSLPDNVTGAVVDMRYPGFNGPSAQQSFELTRAHPTASFFTYTGQAEEPGPYFYQITYLLSDGQRMTLPEQESRAEQLRIRDPFEERATARFTAQADFSLVEKVVVDAIYRDNGHDYTASHHAELASNGASSEWTIGLRDPGNCEFEYAVIIFKKDGSREDKAARLIPFGGTTVVGSDGRLALDITIIPSLLDWAKYKLVVLSVLYDDQDASIHDEKNFTFKGTASDQIWRVMVANLAKKDYQYRLRYFGIKSEDNAETGWLPSSDTVLVLQ